jgi:hypothetical protein
LWTCQRSGECSRAVSPRMSSTAVPLHISLPQTEAQARSSLERADYTCPCHHASLARLRWRSMVVCRHWLQPAKASIMSGMRVAPRVAFSWTCLVLHGAQLPCFSPISAKVLFRNMVILGYGCKEKSPCVLVTSSSASSPPYITEQLARSPDPQIRDRAIAY